MTIEIPLTQGKVALIDDEDWPLVSGYKWRALNCASGHRIHIYAAAYQPGRGDTVLMHRLLARATTGQLVDHKNGDGLDNRRDNLRLATPEQNSANKRRAANRSQFKGIYPTAKGWWRVRINHHGRVHGYGQYEDEIVAARVYDEAARWHFGEFANTNFG
jgi:hypothetical protein